MATLVNKMNREVKVIIPNMREFRVFYSDNDGSVMFFKRDWVEVKEEHWKPSEEQMKALQYAIAFMEIRKASDYDITPLKDLYNQLKKL